jgi:molybdenum cofactor cytidylyltransferase
MPPALILLAAGGSTRMGRAKQLLPYRGTTLLRHAVNGALASRCHPVVVVIGSEAPMMRAELSGLPVQIVTNLAWASGIGTSIRAGLAALLAQASPPAVVIMLCDQPAVTGDVLNELIDRYQSTHSPIVASSYNGTVGVPALFASTLYDKLLELKNAEGARQIIFQYLDSTQQVPFPEGSNDVDMPEGYDRLK